MPKPKKRYLGEDAKRKYGHSKSPLSREKIVRRRDIVRTLIYQGVKRSQILKTLIDKTDLLRHCRNPWKVVDDDMGLIRKVAKEEAEKGNLNWYNAEYIGQQSEIFAKALAHEDYRAAIEASKNMARARGIDVDEVFRVKRTSLDVNASISDEELDRRIKETEAILSRAEGRTSKKNNQR